MDLALRMGGDDPVHEIEEFDPPMSFVMPGDDLAAADVQGGEQGRGPMPLLSCD